MVPTEKNRSKNSNMKTDRMYLKELQEKLEYEDRRSVTRWCHNNNVRILKDRGSNRRFVMRGEFDNVIEMNNRGAHSGIYSVKDKIKQKFNQLSESVRNYKPIGENEKKALSIFTSIL